ncbi:hypothetical protein ACWT_5668 [Actinoplanes sp. SE50]|uniref:hypothetical protein n=1 Tax=unclassified Actinoplanes TaxID=2626549 RepID=UPI00023ED2C3|nr:MULTISPECIES: hypothetical protein [unclassified Actinoplanes]AEV86685.1 hypothetical protein ACPL_5798 [Actinoplanes sp. SE50/110]ATO85083.1 hypothetical protein ACWT_5668 [Actinoplanes sp. SE50]SLM02494.1 hypothetical protein ACSP50_5744 [Actinoplanes sp. SE50/110]
MSRHANFLGIPVEGDITRGDKRVPQKPLSELEPLMRAVLDDPHMKAFGWEQYTPYFNDGEPCVFSVGSPWFLTVNDPDPDDIDDTYEYGVDYGDHPSLGRREFDWRDRERIPGAYTGPDEARYDRVRALSDAISSGAFEDVLLEAFGDHAQVTVRPSGITVDSYSHD